MTYYIGILGSAFNPPTRGHRDVVEQATSVCEHIVLVPSFQHAFEKKMLGFQSRLILTQIFAKECTVPDCKIEVSAIEKVLFKNAPATPVYTYDLMSAMQQYFYNCFPDQQLLFIRGPDNADPLVWSKFYRYQDIEARWKIFTAIERMPIRSSYVRKILNNHWKTEQKQDVLANFLTPEVAEYIFIQSLFMS